MDVGFSVTLDGSFEAARTAVERVVHEPLGTCDTSDGTRTCGLEIAGRQTLILMAESTGKTNEVLVGWFYAYEK